MTHTKAVVLTTHRGRKACYVPAFPGWEGVEQLCGYLERHFAARCVSRIDGPDARCWRLEIGDASVEIQHEDPWGNMIVACGPDSDDTLSPIAIDLDRRLGHLQ